MSFKVWIKSKAADRVLSPLRKELIELVEENATLLEVGCGTGDLLFKSAHKISSGYGVDVDQEMIGFAELKRKATNLNHLSFECNDALKMAPRQFDIATSTLCLHELPKQKACDLLKMMIDSSNMVLVADYTEAKSTLGKISIEFDELISGHYRNYKNYRRFGEIPSYAEEVGAIVKQEIKSAIDGISIWRIGSKVMP
ncbi:methyltransferase domain-containing protein [Marinomonas mediterranea]|uniref:class I SAM-dependent methyltransferase n=1 Tax=Marinomonas mediterranea TaxID=119864 RepID=UPI00234A55E3|nr:class I SAM-dependent methyltransferase [Marinomonas mediterranea]WCN15065.1 methyltransferase domain-containing protein [Marinomonas mediterranea]